LRLLVAGACCAAVAAAPAGAEPGMLVDTLDSYNRLLHEFSAKGIDASRLYLTIDVGHLHCQGELPIAEKIRASKSRLKNVHIEDMRAGIHEHLMFGDGEIDFPPVIAALREIGYHGVLSVELSGLITEIALPGATFHGSPVSATVYSRGTPVVPAPPTP